MEKKSNQDLREKGLYLIRKFGNLQGALLSASGRPTVLALSARKWGEPVPKNSAAAHKLAKKGEALLKKYHREQRNRVKSN